VPRHRASTQLFVATRLPTAEAGGRPRRHIVRGMHLDVGAQPQSSARPRVKTAMVARVCRPKRAQTSASHVWAAMRQP
jgi:hypothetical protein